MDAQKLPEAMRRATAQLQRYMRDDAPHMVINKALRFVEGNFRAQGYQGSQFWYWPLRKGEEGKSNGRGLLRKTGRLRRGTRGEKAPYMARVYNATPYAAAHNRGFEGTVNVRAHTRRKYTAKEVGTGRYTKSGTERTKTVHTLTGTMQVKSHLRKMNIPKRQFMPESLNDSPVLQAAIKREIINQIKAIFQS